MAKVFGIHTFELRPGANEQDLVKIANELLFPAGDKLGWKGYVLKADRGERIGKFAIIWEVPSVEQRDHFVPTANQPTEEAKSLFGTKVDEFFEKADALVLNWSVTDYVEL
jgi:hypothetical protein